MKTVVAVLLALACLAPLAPTSAAQSEGSDGQGVEEVWTGEDRTLTEDLVVENGTTLVVRGIALWLDNVSVVVREQGRLVIESSSNRSAIVASHIGRSWNGTVLGKIELRGTATHPMVVQNVSGRSDSVPGVVSFSGGLAVRGGAIDMERVVFTGYTSGIIVTQEATGRFSNVTFASGEGRGLVATRAGIEVSDSRFAGPGATLFLSVATEEARLRNVSFGGSALAITIRASNAQLRDVNVTASASCLWVMGGAEVTVDGFRCDYRDQGLTLSQIPNQPGDRPRFVAKGVNATGPSAPGAAINVQSARLVEIRDSAIGPTGGHGVSSTGAIPRLRNVTFQGVGLYPLQLVTPDSEPDPVPPGGGEPGGMGWLGVVKSASVQVIDPDGNPASHARVQVSYRGNDTVAVARELAEDGILPRVLLETMRVEADGTVVNSTYRLVASQDSTGGYYDGELRTDGSLTRIVLVRAASDPTPTSGIPAPPAPLLLLALAGLALARRARR
ncbi:MAG TPA: hypothetical protein VHH36_00265 [Candidatus Thermoplasmatota archaeon]|nr:hypothetical protein [Candidatus Thermoplasmatota archaeon]